MQPIYFTPPSHLDEWMERGINAIYRLIEASHPIILTASGGKDSTLTAIMGLEAIRRANIAGIAQPPHYITSADTTIENPAMLQHLLRFLDDIETHCESLGLGVEVRIAKPALASQFVVSTIGRGTLARTVQNSVKDGKGKRPCSDDWKVRPQNKLKKELQLQASREGFREPVTILV